MTQEKPHIVFLHKDFPFSGAEQVTMDVANYLCQKGYRVTILTINHRETSYPVSSERRFDVQTLPPGKIKRSKNVARAVCDFILKERVAVLITYRELLYARWLKKETGVKLVFELHNTPGYEFLDLADKRRESLWKNMFYGCGIEWILTQFYRQKYRRVYGWCDAYGVLCEGYRRELMQKLGVKEGKDKIWVLPNSIAPVRQVRKDKAKVVLYVGRLTHRDKRVDRLLRIWKLAQSTMQGWHLKIVGSGKAADSLQHMATQIGLERCSFEGYSTLVSDYYDEASILCLTSSFEGWPMCIAEAQSHGVVPVVFDSFAATEDLISNDEEGIRIPPYDEKLFADRLAALALDEPRLCRMQAAVTSKAATYSIERSGKAWIEMLNQLMN